MGEKVLKIYDNSLILDCIDVLLSRASQNSHNTMLTYKRAIEAFFKDTRGKELEHLNERDLMFTKIEIEKYQIELRERFKSSTVNTRMSAMKKLYEKFEENELKGIKASIFNVTRYDNHDKESYDPMTNEEIKKAIDLVKGTRKGLEKSLLIKVAYATAFRNESIRGIKWSDIYNHNGDWIIRTLGKGNKWDHKKISNSLYNELMELKSESTIDRVFMLTDKTVNRMMNFIKDNIDFGDRRITFHSFKKSSINEVAVLTGYDVKAMQRQGNHASPVTTLEDYMQNKNLDDLVVVDIDRDIGLDALDDLSKEELLELIKSMDRGTQIKMLDKIS